MYQKEIMPIMFFSQWLTYTSCSIINDYYFHTYTTLATVAEIASQWHYGGQRSFTSVTILTYMSCFQNLLMKNNTKIINYLFPPKGPLKENLRCVLYLLKLRYFLTIIYTQCSITIRNMSSLNKSPFNLWGMASKRERISILQEWDSISVVKSQGF